MERIEKIRKVTSQRQPGIIVLEDVHDPHNVQAVVRSAEGFGFQTIYLIFEKEKPFDPKRVGKETSSSANKWVDYKIFKSSDEALNKLKDDGYENWATVLDEKAQSLLKTKFSKEKVAIWFGNEHSGLSENVIKKIDKKVYIPMRGMVQSLNISVTAAIFMWEISRQRGFKISLDCDNIAQLNKDFDLKR